MATQLTKFFTLEELYKSAKADALKIDNTPPENILPNLKQLAMLLESVRTALGKPMNISSAYRCPKLNEAVGGSKTSAHAIGLAADFTVKGLTPRQICLAIVNAGIKFDQLILESVSTANPDGVWVHIGLSTTPLRNQVLTMKSGKYFAGLIK